MRDNELTPQQLEQIKGVEAALTRHIERVNVDMPSAMQKLHGERTLEKRISETEYVIEVELDASAMLRVLKELPDRAGTEAFVAAYAQAKNTEAALMRHIVRVNVDMPSALARIDAEPPLEERIKEAAFMEAILRTLEELPDRAGTDAFVAGFNARTDGR